MAKKKIRRKIIKIAFAGYSGENNTGAEARVAMTVRDIKRAIGEEAGSLQITIPTLSEANTRRYVPDEDVCVMEMGNIFMFILRMLKIVWQWNDMLFLVEGAAFTDHFSPFFIYIFLFSALVGKLCGKKVVVYAVDCGELKPFSRKFLRWVGNKLDLIIARTEDSKERMIRFGVKKPIYVTTDTVFQYQPPGREFALALLKELKLDPEKPIVGLAAKEFFWFPIKAKLWGPKEDFYHYPLYHTWTPEGRRKSKIFKQDFVNYADWIVEKLDANVLLIAMERMDLPPSQDIHNLMKRKDRARVISSNDYDMRDISALLSTLKFLTTTRYHACVLAVPSAIPLVAVSSDIRLEGVFREMGIMDYYIDIRTESLYGDMVRVSEKLLGNESECRAKVAAAYPRYLERDAENRRILKEWFLDNFEPVR